MQEGETDYSYIIGIVSAFAGAFITGGLSNLIRLLKDVNFVVISFH